MVYSVQLCIGLLVSCPYDLACSSSDLSHWSLQHQLIKPYMHQNYGAFFDTWGVGITGPVILKGLANGNTLDLSYQKWTYQVSLHIWLKTILYPF